jgi:hypothetical protein
VASVRQRLTRLGLVKDSRGSGRDLTGTSLVGRDDLAGNDLPPPVACLLLVAACSGERTHPTSDSVESRTPRPAAESSGIRQAATGQRSGRSPIALPFTPQPSWLTFKGEGFTLRYPPDAIVSTFQWVP